jgi:hypothetical protein
MAIRKTALLMLPPAKEDLRHDGWGGWDYVRRRRERGAQYTTRRGEDRPAANENLRHD